MLKKLQIKNFQKHEKLRINLDPAITTIVGPSDTGKSSIIRALRWLTMNQPRGFSFVREGTDSCSVKLQVQDSTIERKRNPSNNCYKLNGNELKAFGTNVPDTIASILNLGDTNFALQHEQPFWFSLTSGEVAKQLNKIVDLESIDRIIGNVNKRLRKAKTEAEIIKERLDKVQIKLNELEYVLPLSEELETLEALADKKTKATEKASTQNKLTSDAREKKEKVESLKELAEDWLIVCQHYRLCQNNTKYTNELDILLPKASNANNIVSLEIPSADDLDFVVKFRKKHKLVTSSLNELNKLLLKIKQIQESADKEIPDLDTLQSKIKKMKGLNESIQALQVLLGDASGKRSLVKKLSDKLSMLQEDLLERTEGICPVCGNNL